MPDCTREGPDALAEALEAHRVERVAVAVMDGLASGPLGDEHQPRGVLAIGEGWFGGLGDEGRAVRHARSLGRSTESRPATVNRSGTRTAVETS